MKGMMKAAAPMVARVAEGGLASKLTPRGPVPQMNAGWASFRQPGDKMRAGWDAHFNRPSRPDGTMGAPMQPSPPTAGQPSRAQQLMQAFAQARR